MLSATILDDLSASLDAFAEPGSLAEAVISAHEANQYNAMLDVLERERFEYGIDTGDSRYL